MHRVVKPFPYSVDGFTLIDLNVGDERDFGSMADGLVDEGFVEVIVVAKPEPVIVDKPEPAVVDKPSEVEEAPFEMAVDHPRRGRKRG